MSIISPTQQKNMSSTPVAPLYHSTTSLPAPSPQELDLSRPLWLWENRILSIGLTILEGPTGIGKTLCALNLAASVSRGLMPDNTPCPQGKVLYLTQEDSPEDFLLPVLERAHAHMPSIDVLRVGIDFNQDSLSFLYETFTEDRPRLVIIDSLHSTLGRHPKLNDAGLAEIVHELFEMAWTCRTSILLIRNADMKGYPRTQTRLEKSPHLTAAAQSILLLSPDTTDPGSVLLSLSKCSLAGNTPTISFRVSSDPAQNDPYPSLLWSLVPNVSGSDLCHLQHTGSLPYPDLSDAVLAILRERLDQPVNCQHICKLLDDPTLKPNSVSQALLRLERRGILVKPSYACYQIASSRPFTANSLPVPTSPATDQPTTQPVPTSPTPAQTVNLSNSSPPPAQATQPAPSNAQNSVKLSNSAANHAQPVPSNGHKSVKLSNSAGKPTQPAPSNAQNSVKLSNSAGKPARPSSSNGHNPVKVLIM